MDEKSKIIRPNAKEFEILQKSFMKPDENNPEYRKFLQDDALKSMKEKLKLYGTSRDPSEFQNPPEYSNPTTYKGFTVMLVKYKNKFSGQALDLETGTFSLQGDWKDTEHEAGKQIFKYIDIFRKSTHGRSTRNLAGERSAKLNLN